MAQFDPPAAAFPAAGAPGPAHPAAFGDPLPGAPAPSAGLSGDRTGHGTPAEAGSDAGDGTAQAAYEAAATSPGAAIVPPAPTTGRISLLRALGELGAVYAAAFGLGIVSAIVLLRDPNFDNGDQVINSLQSSLIEIFNYVMQASVVIFGVGYFSLRRGLSLRTLFGRFRRPAAYSADPYNVTWPTPGGDGSSGGKGAPAANGAYGPYGAYPAPPGQGYGYGYGVPAAAYGSLGYAVAPPVERGPGWQFARTFFVAMGGFIAFLILAITYMSVTQHTQGAPDQGTSLWLIPVGAVVSAAAGFGEEMLITGMTVTVLEQAGFGRRPWVIYLIAICLRIPFHLYYGWAALGVICFTVTNVWAYRRWRLLWPIVLAHAAYDFVESVTQTLSNAAGVLLIFALAITTLVMVIIIACIEGSDGSTRRRFSAFAEYQGGAAAGFGRPAADQPIELLHPVVPPSAQPAELLASDQPVPSGPADPLMPPAPPAPTAPFAYGQPIQPSPMSQPPVLRIPDPVPQQPPQPPSLLVPDPVQQPVSTSAAQPPETPEPPQFPAF